MRLKSCAKTASSLLALPWWTAIATATEVSFCTDVGNFVIELDAARAPLHAANFLQYVERGHFNGTVFHRVIAEFMIQGGGFDTQMVEKPTLQAIRNESKNGLSNTRGSVAAARTTAPHSATSQFYINLADNTQLDGTSRDWGYTVFGHVSEGMEAIERIGSLPTRSAGPFRSDVPDPLVAIRSAAILDRAALDPIPDAERAERLRANLDAALANGGLETAMLWLDQLRAACLPPDSSVLMQEAEVAAQLQRMARAKAALDEYFSLVDESAPGYDAALNLYARIAPEPRSRAFAAIGNCGSPEVPAIPDGSAVALEEMLAGQLRVQEFMRDSTAFLECLEEIIDDKSNDDEQRAAALNEYNRMVDITQQLGDDFNAQVRQFRARQ